MTPVTRFGIRNGTVFDEQFLSPMASPALIVRKDNGKVSGCGNLHDLTGPFKNMTSGFRARGLTDLASEMVLVPLGQPALDVYDRAMILNLIFSNGGDDIASRLAAEAKFHPEKTPDLVKRILAEHKNNERTKRHA